MSWIVIILLYCIFCILLLVLIRENIRKLSGKILFVAVILLSPLGFATLPIWLPIFLVNERRKKKQLKKWKDMHKCWMKEYKARSIIGGAERAETAIEAEMLTTYRCKKCGYTLQSSPQGFFKLSSEVYYHFKCEKCKNIVSICSKDLSNMSYLQHCPICEETQSFSFWNPIEGRCPKCDGLMSSD